MANNLFINCAEDINYQGKNHMTFSLLIRKRYIYDFPCLREIFISFFFCGGGRGVGTGHEIILKLPYLFGEYTDLHL